MSEVVLVHDHLNQQGGAEKVLLSLHGIFPQSPVYTLLYDARAMGAAYENMHVRDSFLSQIPGSKKFFKWFLIAMPRAIESLDVGNAQVVISSASHFAKGIPKKNALHICYCHTPTRYLWSHADQYTEELAVPRIIKKILPRLLEPLRTWDLQAAGQVDHFIANSNIVAERIQKYYNRTATVMYPPVATDDFFISPEIDDYFVVLSRFRPYKRVDLAIKTFNKLGMPLKIIGSGEEEKRLKKIAKKNIEFLGRVSDTEKANILSKARALIHPQADEDFGITAVEAMAAGRPVIAYRGGGVLETVVEGTTGVFFDDQSWEALAETVIRFDHTTFDPQSIRRHAQQFDTTVFEKNIRTFLHSLDIAV